MAVLTSAARSSPLHSLAWFRARHPQWWVYAVAGCAWVALVLMSVAPKADVAATGHHMHSGLAMPVTSESFVASWSGAWSHWVLMVAAMMLPVVAPQVRTVALRSVWTRRQRSATAFVLGYAAVWVVAGAALLALLVALDAHPLGAGWLVGILLVAAVWQVSKPRKRVLRRCASLRLLAANGRPADLNCARVGVRSGVRCLATCGPLMLAMVATHSLLLMAALLAVMLTERSRGPDPLRRVGRPLEAWVLVGFALVAGLVAVQ